MSGHLERLTFFSDYKGYKSSNPVIGDDGKLLAFQMARYTDLAGIGYGIFTGILLYNYKILLNLLIPFKTILTHRETVTQKQTEWVFY